MNQRTSTITLTFGDMAENHVGMQQIGTRDKEGSGFTKKDLYRIAQRFPDHDSTIYSLHRRGEIMQGEKAYVLVIRNGLSALLDDFTMQDFFKEQAGLDVDKKVFMYGAVKNKHARWNLCFDEKSQEPDYEHGKGRIIAYDDVPILKNVYDNFPTFFGKKGTNLKGEGNYYYDIRKCGIGFHGDTERRKVIALRLGADLPIHYQWYQNSKPVGKRIIIPLFGGDIYVMSEKAVGTDWKSRNKLTLRHGVGKKYVKL